MAWTRDDALARDAADPLGSERGLFCFPAAPDGQPSVYLCGNSLGLMPKATREAVRRELDDWGALGVEGHFKERDGWYAYHELVRGPLARLVGAREHEVVAMNSLTVNLHLLMLSFYRPKGERCAILIDRPCFPSDVYAVKSQLRLHGVDVEKNLLRIEPRQGEVTIRTEDVIALIEREASRLGVVLLAGVNYVTGQLMEIEKITAAAHRAGVLIGWDLAHAAGNAVLKLHDWGVDFAVWCSYKYLNSGPGAVAGAYVHERHTRGVDASTRAAMPRLEGWWGNDPSTRFEMGEQFVPIDSADAWQLSNPPILALAPLKVSLGIFDRVGIEVLRSRSEKLTAYLESLVRELGDAHFQIITPREASHRGCQLSIRVRHDAPGLLKRLQAAGVICDFRRPDVIRVAPTPLYNSYEDCWRFADVLAKAVG